MHNDRMNHSVIVSREEEAREYFANRDVSKLSVGENVSCAVLNDDRNHSEDVHGSDFFVFDDYLLKRYVSIVHYVWWHIIKYFENCFFASGKYMSVR